MARRQCHRLIEKEEFGPAPIGHDIAATTLVFATADQPCLARPASVQQRFGCRIVDNAAIAREQPSLRNRHDIAEGVTRF